MTTRRRPRSLDVRLTDYRDSLVSVASQLESQILPLMPRDADTTALKDSIKLYRIVSEDLTKLLDGDELKEFIVTGTIPTT